MRARVAIGNLAVAALAATVAGCGGSAPHRDDRAAAHAPTPAAASSPQQALAMRREALQHHNIAEICATSDPQTLRDVYRDALGVVPKQPPSISRCVEIYSHAFFRYDWIDCEGRAADGVLTVAPGAGDTRTGELKGIDGVVSPVVFHRDGPGGGWTMSELCQMNPPS